MNVMSYYAKGRKIFPNNYSIFTASEFAILNKLFLQYNKYAVMSEDVETLVQDLVEAVIDKNINYYTAIKESYRTTFEPFQKTNIKSEDDFRDETSRTNQQTNETNGTGSNTYTDGENSTVETTTTKGIKETQTTTPDLTNTKTFPQEVKDVEKVDLNHTITDVYGTQDAETLSYNHSVIDNYSTIDSTKTIYDHENSKEYTDRHTLNTPATQTVTRSNNPFNENTEQMVDKSQTAYDGRNDTQELGSETVRERTLADTGDSVTVGHDGSVSHDYKNIEGSPGDVRTTDKSGSVTHDYKSIDGSEGDVTTNVHTVTGDEVTKDTGNETTVREYDSTIPDKQTVKEARSYSESNQTNNTSCISGTGTDTSTRTGENVLDGFNNIDYVEAIAAIYKTREINVYDILLNDVFSLICLPLYEFSEEE